MPIDAALWYDATPDTTAFYQGDVLDGVPVVAMPPAGAAPWILLRPSAPVTLERAIAGDIPKIFRPYSESSAPDAWASPEELVLAKGAKKRVLLITQTCDIDQRKFVHVAPVYEAARISAGRQASLRENEINYLFFLPPSPPELLDESFADLSHISLVHRSYLQAAALVKRLTPRAGIELQAKRGRFFGRPFGFTTRDAAPQASEYVCIACFLRTAIVQRVTIAANERFTPCPGCGDQACWVKFQQAT